MKLEITKEEQQQLLACIDAAIKASQSSLQTASALMPLAVKINNLADSDEVVAEEKAQAKKK